MNETIDVNANPDDMTTDFLVPAKRPAGEPATTIVTLARPSGVIQDWFSSAWRCRFFAIDQSAIEDLRHRSFCLHPSRPNAKETGRYVRCQLVHYGICDIVQATVEGIPQ